MKKIIHDFAYKPERKKPVKTVESKPPIDLEEARKNIKKLMKELRNKK